MSCPTCDHTMHVCCRIGGGDGPRVLHCPRCGTQIIEFAMPIVTVPKLVERCREFDGFVRATASGPSVDHWIGTGIAESIYPPDRRPPR